MQTRLAHHWHHLPASEVAQLLDTDPEQGLDPFTLADRQKHFGPNLLSARQGRGSLVRFLLQFHQPLIHTLLAAALVTGLFKELVDVLLAVEAELAEAGYLAVEKEGRCNRYEVQRDFRSRHPLESHHVVGQLLDLLGRD